ncbi:hypothetical protein CCGE531_02010 [Rhizobium sp. CCGE531]|nr:hypothetical protein CCGE531_02010 [Rhizobium sp. CCGE531]AYG74403.1 hypothetical protein CCGE532_02000 [Rhizobium sp. CCGE532]
MSCRARPEKRAAHQATSAKDRILGVFLSFARLIGRLHMDSDLQRLIVATSCLMRAFIHYSAD